MQDDLRELIFTMLSNGGETSIRNALGQTLLHRAVSVQGGYSITTPCRVGETLLHCAGWKQHCHTTQGGYSTTTPFRAGTELLHRNSQCSWHAGYLRHPLGSGTTTLRSSLPVAFIKSFLSRVELISVSPSTGSDDMRLVQLLVESNADLSAVDHKGNTPLMALCELKTDHLSKQASDWSTRVIQYLARQDSVQLDVRSRDGRSALFNAMLRGVCSAFAVTTCTFARKWKVPFQIRIITHVRCAKIPRVFSQGTWRGRRSCCAQARRRRSPGASCRAARPRAAAREASSPAAAAARRTCLRCSPSCAAPGR